MQHHRDVVVIGGGIVGLATAHRLLEARPQLSVTVLERADDVATQQSSRNSGVVHAGLYYPPGSSKARWCSAGRVHLERFCAEQGLPFERTGKVVVAVRTQELAGLAALAARARANGVPVEELDAAALREREPAVRGIAGLWSPATAVTDFGAVARRLAELVKSAGGEVLTGTAVTSLHDREQQVRVITSRGELTSRFAVSCAGHGADRLASVNGRARHVRIVPFRGSWLELQPSRSSLVRGNIYPVPVAGGLPFLGVHLTRRVDGRVWIGPNAVLALARSGTRPFSVDRRDLLDIVTFPGTWRLARRHLPVAAGEIWRDRVLAATLREVRRYVPDITSADVRRGPWGVRAQLVSRDGNLVEDFVVEASGRVLHVLNAPSPAATASLAIGGALRDRLLGRLDA